MKITKTFVDKVELPTSGQKIHWDDELKGFCLRVTAAGNKTYVVEKRVKGKTTRRTIGAANVYSNHEARLEAKRLLLEMAQGSDPKIASAERELQNITLGQAFEDYKSARPLKPRTISNYNYTVKKCLSDWLDKPLTSLNRDMV